MTINFFSPLFCCCFWIRDSGSEIRDPGWVKIRIRDPGSGINIPDPQHCSLGFEAKSALNSVSTKNPVFGCPCLQKKKYLIIGVLSTISIFFKSCRKGPWPLYRITKLIDGVKLPGCCIVCYQSRQQAERRMVLTSVAGLRFKSGARSNTNFRNNHKLYLLY